jgi:hypothetical protein
MRSLADWMRSHRRLVAGAFLLGVAAVGFVLVWYQPQKLFLDQTVDEAFPALTPTSAAPTTAVAAAPSTTRADDDPPDPATTAPTGPRLVTTGSFIDVKHAGTGTASVYLLAAETHLLRLEELDVSNGPDLRVILSTAPLVDDRSAYDEDYVDLGPLKGNQGNQNYDIPGDVDLDDYSTVAIWCRRFNYTFNAAPLTPATG